MFFFLRSAISIPHGFCFAVGICPHFVSFSFLGFAHAAADDEDDYDGDGSHRDDDTQADPLADPIPLILTLVARESLSAAVWDYLKLLQKNYSNINH